MIYLDIYLIKFQCDYLYIQAIKSNTIDYDFNDSSLDLCLCFIYVILSSIMIDLFLILNYGCIMKKL